MKAVEVCPRCGLPMERKRYQSALGPYEYLCERCYREQHKVYLDVVTTQMVTFIKHNSKIPYYHKRPGGLFSPLGQEVRRRMEKSMVEVEVVRFEQKGMPMYSGKMKARDLLTTWHVERWKEETLGHTGYQRELFDERCRDIAKYLLECDVAIIPPILVSLRKGFKFDLEKGVLKIPRERGAITVIDGQHRVGGFLPITEEVKKTGIHSDLLDYEVPVVFVDSEAVARKVREVAITENAKKMATDPLSVESAFFFIINKLQKSVRPSHKDVLMYRIFASGIRGIPVIAKEEWKMPIIPVVFRLNLDKDSPLKGLINLADIRGLQRPVHLSTFVKSLGPLFTMDEFKAFREGGMAPTDLAPKQLEYIKRYWNTIRSLWKEAFNKPKSYMILRAIGVYVLNWLAADICEWCIQKGIGLPSEEDIQEYLEPIKDFNWDRKTSPLAGLGGMKGAKEAYSILFVALAIRGVKEAKERIEGLGASEEEIEALKLRASTALKAS